ncbi:CRP-like cAMP-binding protein [Crossiella equi]|uniref:CRP-like cAMP-binding protein n=1 Tax=Crossiella equi TaxID=130796 RepID=A0ABS5A3L5_9PSEU|nr:Crp/Fnr family transcriptional regulator [Crossiella equi]MBP2471168.1 CRP-like cAMP-binding protein [Crossiella equi]
MDNRNNGSMPGDEFLSSSCLLRALDGPTAEAYAKEMDRGCFMSGKWLYTQGSSDDRVHVVLAGLVKIVTTEKDGKHLVCVHGPGDVVGLQAGVKSNTALAAGLVRTATITRSRLQQWAARWPVIDDELHQYATARIAEFGDVYFEIKRAGDHLLLRRLAPPVRLARLYVHLVRRCGVQDGAVLRVKHHLNHTELAELIGSSKEEVHDALTALTRAALVLPARRGVTVLDLEALHHFGR